MRTIGLAFFLVLAGCGGGGGGDMAGTPADMATGSGGNGGSGGSGGGGSGGGGGTGGTGDMAFLSSCGHPGDVGNSIGVGKFCHTISDCTGNGLKTTICSALGNGSTPSAGDTYFCTIYPCTPPDGGTPTNCGDNATCVCASNGGNSGCACTPDSCK
jgi:hypothetical protein